jgi:hypothetical protein
MFPPFIDDKNVHLTTYDKPGFFKSSEYKDYPIDAEFALVASEVRSMAMAAWRYRGRHYHGRQRRLTSESGRSTSRPGSVGGSNGGSRKGSVAASEGGGGEEREEDEDMVLIGFDEGSEGEEELDDDGQEGEDDDE